MYVWPSNRLSYFRSDTVGEWVRRRVESGVGAVISGGSPCRSTRSTRSRPCPNRPPASLAPPFPKCATIILESAPPSLADDKSTDSFARSAKGLRQLIIGHQAVSHDAVSRARW